MSTIAITYPPARPIQHCVEVPCWVWDSVKHAWERFGTGSRLLLSHTHWTDIVDMPPPPPPEPPDVTCEREVARLKGELEAAVQHVKILTEQRDTAHHNLRDAQDRLIRAGLSSPRPAAPKAQKVLPWKAEDVPLGCWLRWKESPYAVVALACVASDRVTLTHGSTHPLAYPYLAEKMEHSTDGGKTWSPAGRVVYEEAA
jgi:hypothetical protein